MSPVITVDSLSKKYPIGYQKQERYTALRDVLTNGAKRFTDNLRHPFAVPGNDPAHEEFRALARGWESGISNLAGLRVLKCVYLMYIYKGDK